MWLNALDYPDVRVSHQCLSEQTVQMECVDKYGKIESVAFSGLNTIHRSCMYGALRSPHFVGLLLATVGSPVASNLSL